jgi:hypothetical protein
MGGSGEYCEEVGNDKLKIKNILIGRINNFE